MINTMSEKEQTEVVLMEQKRDDRRTQYSKRVIKESLFQLMQEKPINTITVKELCERADVNRSTFYAYYTDIYDLDRKIIKEFFKMQRSFINKCLAIMDTKPDATDLTVKDFYEITLLHLQLVKQNKEIYKFAFYGQANTSIQISYDKVFYSVINKRIPDKYKESFRRAFTFVSGGTTAVFVRWLLTDCAAPAEELAKSLAYYYYGVFNGHKK